MADQKVEIVAGPSNIRQKRRSDLLIGSEGIQSSTAKKARIASDENKQVQCLKFIIYSYEKIKTKTLKMIDENMENITIANQISDIIFLVFSILRGRANGSDENTERRATNKNKCFIRSMGKTYTITIDDAIKCCEEAASEAEVEFKRYDINDPKNWYETAASHIAFFMGNGLRMRELRKEPNNMFIIKYGDRTKSFPVKKYGLNGYHCILLRGSKYSSKEREALAQYVGPMTSLLLHIRSDEKSRKKWTNVARRVMAHVPMIDEILEVTKGRRAKEVRNLICTLANILLVCGGQDNRMFFPLNMLAKAYRFAVNKDDILIDEEKHPMPYVGGDTLLRGFNASGNGGFYLYNLCCLTEFVLEGAFNSVEAQQVLFHSIFGTEIEDLSILEQMTALDTWNTRKQFGDKFQKMTTCGSSTKFHPVRVIKYSNLASGPQSDLLATAYLQTLAVPVMGGLRNKHFTHAFFEQMSSRTRSSMVPKTIPQITLTLTNIWAQLTKNLLEAGGEIHCGMSKWRLTAGMDIVNGGPEVDDVLCSSTQIRISNS
ncbi:hypothetical protein ABEB36_011129 [Hypothenemus hampei]|uniref:Nucleoprotein n=1 Tax=Hypothenemus hampei TaxID=57062 RepID=A0ABD1EEY3_HYPHA